MRAGFVSYINALPLIMGLQTEGMECIYAPPATLNQLLKEGKLDVALTSSIFYLQHQDQYACSSDFGIASKEQVLSVNFYTRLPLHQLNGSRIGLTADSATSVALLQLLCRKQWKISPTFEPFRLPKEEYDAFLLIGDEALQHQTIAGYTTIDLAHEWKKWTSLPFVFALFIYPNKTPVPTFFDQIRKSYQWGQRHQDSLYAQAEKQSGLPKKTVIEYFNTLQYRFSDREINGLKKFHVYTTTT